MKRFLLATVLIAASYFATSQSFYLTINDTILGDSIIVYPSDSAVSKIYFTATLHNNTNNGVNIKVVRNEIEVVDGTSNMFKWGGEYYNDTINLSTDYIYIPAGSSCPDTAFIAQFIIGPTLGLSYIDYTFFDIENQEENVKIVVEYDSFHTPDGVDENIFKYIAMSDIYPNPATDFVQLDYRISQKVDQASIVICDLMGRIVVEQNIVPGENKARINVSDLPMGYYLYSMSVNGYKYITKKLIVK